MFGNEPELLHHAQSIVALPLLDYLGSFEGVYCDAFELYLLPSGRAKLLCLSLVSAAYGVAGYQLLTLGFRILDTDVDAPSGSRTCLCHACRQSKNSNLRRIDRAGVLRGPGPQVCLGTCGSSNFGSWRPVMSSRVTE